MGNQSSIPYFSFEDMQSIIQKDNTHHYTKKSHIIINTMSESLQQCLIPNTEPIQSEVEQINHFVQHNTNITIIIYGMHCCDSSVYTKYNQLIKLGFSSIYIYRGGLFEWLCLQDIYGDEAFPTTSKELDILKFKPVFHRS